MLEMDNYTNHLDSKFWSSQHNPSSCRDSYSSSPWVKYFSETLSCTNGRWQAGWRKKSIEIHPVHKYQLGYLLKSPSGGRGGIDKGVQISTYVCMNVCVYN